jgi:glycosyltransferase involved in cell wall biosynthesis
MRSSLTDESAAANAPALAWRVPGRLAYVVNHSFPYSSDGYAVRTHGVACGLAALGHSIIVLNRPGRPWDMPDFDARGFPSYTTIDDVRYVFSRLPARGDQGAEEWCMGAADALERHLRVFKPVAVMAASNWENAYPALTAARRLRLPFFYEVRGLWELSRLAREPEWEDTKDFQDEVEMERKVSEAADIVFTLNASLRAELVRRGLSASRTRLAPNGVGELPDLARPPSRSARQLGLNGKYVVGYVGSFGAYEGLDDLVRACATLSGQGFDLNLLLVGSSRWQGLAGSTECSATAALRSLAQQLSFADRLVMPGRVPPSETFDYYAHIDLIVIPRLPLRVCEVVAPLKPLDAAAHGKAMLLSNVAPLREYADESRSAQTFEAGVGASLVAGIAGLLKDPERRTALGRGARLWVTRERGWSRVVQAIHHAIANSSTSMQSAARSDSSAEVAAAAP